MSRFPPKKENENKGFHYTVTEEQVAAHRKRSLKEIFEWLESGSRFIYRLQTNEERERCRKAKGGDDTRPVFS